MSTLNYNSSRNANFFEIPEMLEHLTQYLDPKDIFRCITVSKDWHHFFISTLWKEVCFDNINTVPTAHTLSKHSGFVRTLSVYVDIISDIDEVIFPGLKELHLGGIHSSRNIFSPILLSNNQTLEKISLSAYVHVPDDHEFWETLSNLQNLKSIDVAHSRITIEAADSFWSTICKLESARLEDIKFYGGSPTFSTSPCELRSLTITCRAPYPTSQLQLEFMEKCTRLESLSWSAECTGGELVKRFLSHCWPDLHQLELNFVKLDHIQFQQILDSLSRLTRLVIDNSWVAESFNALSQHFETLEVLDTCQAMSFTSLMANTIMCSCPNLGAFTGSIINGADIINGNRIDTEEHASHEWVCTRLRILKIRFNLRDIDSQIPILERLSKLTQLSQLDLPRIGARTISFSLDDGLDLLKSLRCLTSVYLTGINNMTETDIEWILKNWKCLRKFSGIVNQDSGVNNELRRLLRKNGITTW